MAGHSRSKNGVASLAYDPAIHVFLTEPFEDVDARHKAGHDEPGFYRLHFRSSSKEEYRRCFPCPAASIMKQQQNNTAEKRQ